jgi:hypothetical protein
MRASSRRTSALSRYAFTRAQSAPSAHAGAASWERQRVSRVAMEARTSRSSSERTPSSSTSATSVRRSCAASGSATSAAASAILIILIHPALVGASHTRPSASAPAPNAPTSGHVHLASRGGRRMPRPAAYPPDPPTLRPDGNRERSMRIGMSRGM